VISSDLRSLSASRNAGTTPSKASPAASNGNAAAPVDRASIGQKPAYTTPAFVARPNARPDAAPPGKPQYVPGQVLVKFHPTILQSDVTELAKAQGFSIMRHFDVPPAMVESFGGELYQFKLQPTDSVAEAIKRLSGQPGVSYVEPNYKVQLDDPKHDNPTPPPAPGPSPSPGPAPTENIPNDLDPKLWGMHNTGQNGGTPGVDIGATRAWATETGKPNGQGPLIVIIDTGLDYNHPDLKANVWTNPNETPGNGKDDDGDGIIDDMHGANLINKSGDPMDDNDHGTHCAGTIAGVGNNGQGVVGVNWNATIASAKFLDSGGGGTYADAIDAVLYATKIGARVTSNSWGGSGYSKALEDAFRASPAIHIAAAGNESANNDTNPSYPAAFNVPNMIAVAAHDRNDNLADFSNYGPHTVHVAAPGVDIYSTKPNNSFQLMSGTSMATPHVSGVVGLLLAHDPTLTNDQIKARLVNTAVKAPAYQGKLISNGRVNAANALKTDNTPPATPSDFAVKTAGASAMTVSWTEVGDDGMNGNASSYEIRVSSQPITEDGANGTTAWSDAQTVVTGNPSAPGSPETVNVPISPDDTAKPYYFGLKVADGVGNTSALSTASGTSVAATIAFKDDFDTDNNNWTLSPAQGGWGKVDEPGRGKVFTDSPKGSYPDNSNTSITSVPISLANISNPHLLFDEKHDTEKNYDFAHVEISSDGGQTFQELAKFDGTSDWTTHNIDLTNWQGKTVQIRFRMTSDGSIDKDGFYVDNVKVAGG
jgi:subtilisin family serine protease